MSMRPNQERFKKIVKNKVRRDLKKYVSKQELIGQVGKEKVSIPVPNIARPRFQFDDMQSGGVGQGEGQPGDPVGGQPQPGDGSGEAGKDAGQHTLEIDVTIDELAELLGEELELPNIEPKGEKNIEETGKKYNTIQREGPSGLRHVKRTFKENLKRQMIDGSYNPDNPVVLPRKEDNRYKAPTPTVEPMANAVIFLSMDVSGSMGEEQKELARILSFWIDTWLRKHYKNIETRYIIHDAKAREVDRERFFSTKESGGTKVSSAYQLMKETIQRDYQVENWNIYTWHISDGDNWGGDTEKCLEIMEQALIPWCNQFSYAQVESRYGSGELMEDFRGKFGSSEKVALAEIPDRDAILGAIKTFFNRGN